MTREERLDAAQQALLAGDAVQADHLYRNVLTDEPENARALDGLGVLLCQQGETTAGLEYFNRALDSIETSDSLARSIVLYHHALAYREQGNRNEAIKSCRQSLDCQPNAPEVVLTLGQIYHEQGRNTEAIDCFRLLTTLQKENPSLWLTLGYILSQQQELDQAIPALEQAFRLDSASPEASFFLAEALRKTERYEESLPHYQRMLQVGLEWPQAIHGYGKSLLALGHLEEGWDAVEFRLASSFGTWERHYLPNWNSMQFDQTDSGEKTVLAYSEDGIAADLMFASCLPDLINSVDHCVVECENSLHSLFRRSFPRATFVPLTGESIGAVESGKALSPETARRQNPWDLSLDSQIAFGSLPKVFRRSYNDFPMRKAYLVPDRDRVEKWSNRLAEIGDVKKIGVLWQGGWSSETEHQTSLPIPEVQDLLRRYSSNVAWISLQNGSAQKKIESCCRKTPFRLHRFPEVFQYDLDELAAFLTALDLVITPPGHVAHLAGALGVRVWLILPQRSDWRWNLGTQESLWHPTMQMYRKTAGRSWSALFERVDEDLQKLLEKHRPPEEESPSTLAFPSVQTGTLRNMDLSTLRRAV